MTKPARKQTPNSLAAEIRQLRSRLQLTQTQFARKLGVSQQTLSDWERGRRLRAVLQGMRLKDLLQSAPRKR